MICIDTSVWVAALRDRGTLAGRVLDELLERDEVALPIPVRVEILSGVSRTQEPRLRRALSALPLLFPTDATWERIDGWIREGVERGHRFGLGDLLIAAIAADHGLPLWSLDSDFRRMQHLGFIDGYDAQQHTD